MSERTKEFELSEMMVLHKKECPRVMFEYFMDNHCWKYLEDNTDCFTILIMHEGAELKRYGMSEEETLQRAIEIDKEALQRAIEVEDYIEAARLKDKLNNLP